MIEPSHSLLPIITMPTVFQTLLAVKKAETEKAKRRWEQLQREVAALECVAAMPLPQELLRVVPALGQAKFSRKEKSALRYKQVMELFGQHGGKLRLQTIVSALKVSRNAAKEWMNSLIDRSPETCPWTRVGDNRSRFMLKPTP